MSLVNRIINRTNEKTTTTNTAMEESREQENTKQLVFCSLTHIEGLTQQINKILRSDYTHIRTAGKQTKTIGSLFPTVKDKTPLGENTNVVYKIQCNGNKHKVYTGKKEELVECKASYIGFTTRKLKQRTSEHQSNMNELQKLWNLGYTTMDEAIINLQKKTALVEHAATAKHLFDLEGSKICSSDQ